MTKEEIAAILKELRISSGKTQKEVAELLGRKQQIVGHWETGYSQPDANTLFTLCEIYNTSVDEAFGFKKENITITKKDIDLLNRFHTLDSYGKETLNIVLDRELERMDQIKSVTNSSSKLRYIHYYQRLASAGNGEYLFDDIPTDLISVPVNDISSKADFVIGVNGDSMEPTFKDGDKVFVERCQIIKTGEIGIFMIDNNCVIKEAGDNGLISHNKKYPFIPGTESIQCIGKVLGKLDTKPSINGKITEVKIRLKG